MSHILAYCSDILQPLPGCMVNCNDNPESPRTDAILSDSHFSPSSYYCYETVYHYLDGGGCI